MCRKMYLKTTFWVFFHLCIVFKIQKIKNFEIKKNRIVNISTIVGGEKNDTLSQTKIKLFDLCTGQNFRK